MNILISMNNVAANKTSKINVRRFEKGDSYVQFTFEGAYCKMRNTLLGRAEMTRTVALDSIARLEADGWVETDAC